MDRNKSLLLISTATLSADALAHGIEQVVGLLIGSGFVVGFLRGMISLGFSAKISKAFFVSCLVYIGGFLVYVLSSGGGDGIEVGLIMGALGCIPLAGVFFSIRLVAWLLNRNDQPNISVNSDASK